MRFIERLSLNGLLSFPPDMEPFEMGPLNVLIGPNGSGKSNFIEALELLRATPTDFAAAIRDGGGASEWLWKGETPPKPATINLETGDRSSGLQTPTGRALRYVLEFDSINNRTEVADEAIEEVKAVEKDRLPFFYYRFQRGYPALNVRLETDGSKRYIRKLRREDLRPDQSVLAQRKDMELYPEVTWLGRRFGEIQTFREWHFGRYTPLRGAQRADLPEDRLLPNNQNLALLVNQLEHRDPKRFNEIVKQFFPRFERISTPIHAGSVQLYLHEPGFSAPIPSSRLSDGTMRFIALLVVLLDPSPPPLVCIEEPELGLHPDALAPIGELLIEASERTQLVVTTHSDALVSAFSSQPDAVVACERLGAGTTLERLDPEELAHWLEDYALGDVWRMGRLGATP